MLLWIRCLVFTNRFPLILFSLLSWKTPYTGIKRTYRIWIENTRYAIVPYMKFLTTKFDILLYIYWDVKRGTSFLKITNNVRTLWMCVKSLILDIYLSVSIHRAQFSKREYFGGKLTTIDSIFCDSLFPHPNLYCIHIYRIYW